MSNLKLIISIIQYLKEECRNETLTPNTRESLEVAVQYLQTACDLEPNDPRLNETEAFSLAALFEKALASPSSTDAPSTSKGTNDPLENAEMMNHLGDKLMKREIFSEAVRYYTAAIALDDQNAIYYCNRAAAYSELGNFENAVIDCKKAVGIDPLYARAYGRLGLAHASLNEYQKAIVAFSTALEVHVYKMSHKFQNKLTEVVDDRMEEQPEPLAGQIDKPMSAPPSPPTELIHFFNEEQPEPLAGQIDKPMSAPPSPPTEFIHFFCEEQPEPLAGQMDKPMSAPPSPPTELIHFFPASSLIQDPNIASALTNSINNTLNPNAASGSSAEESSGSTAEGSSGYTAGESSGSGSERSSGPQTPPPSTGFDPTNMDALFEAEQYLAAQLQAADPSLVEQIRQNTSRNNSQGPDGSSSE